MRLGLFKGGFEQFEMIENVKFQFHRVQKNGFLTVMNKSNKLFVPFSRHLFKTAHVGVYLGTRSRRTMI